MVLAQLCSRPRRLDWKDVKEKIDTARGATAPPSGPPASTVPSHGQSEIPPPGF